MRNNVTIIKSKLSHLQYSELAFFTLFNTDSARLLPRLPYVRIYGRVCVWMGMIECDALLWSHCLVTIWLLPKNKLPFNVRVLVSFRTQRWLVRSSLINLLCACFSCFHRDVKLMTKTLDALIQKLYSWQFVVVVMVLSPFDLCSYGFCVVFMNPWHIYCFWWFRCYLCLRYFCLVPFFCCFFCCSTLLYFNFTWILFSWDDIISYVDTPLWHEFKSKIERDFW